MAFRMAKEKLSFKPWQQEAGSGHLGSPSWVTTGCPTICLNENPVEDFKDECPFYCIARIWDSLYYEVSLNTFWL